MRRTRFRPSSSSWPTGPGDPREPVVASWSWGRAARVLLHLTFLDVATGRLVRRGQSHLRVAMYCHLSGQRTFCRPAVFGFAAAPPGSFAASNFFVASCGDFKLSGVAVVSPLPPLGSSLRSFSLKPSPGTIGSPSQYQMPSSSRFKNRVALPGTGVASCAGSHRECSRLTSVN